MCNSQGTQDALVDANELNQEARHSDEAKVHSQDHAVATSLTTPQYQQPRNGEQRDCLVDLCRMDSIKRRRQPLRKGNSPWKLAGLAVIVTNQEAADSPDSMAYRQRWSGGCKGREKR